MNKDESAAPKKRLGAGLYYSQDLDWHEKHGGYLSNNIRCAGTTWDNNWDFPNEDEKDFSICFENKIMPQVKESLTQYGELCRIWFDVPMTICDAQSRQIYETIKRYQPNCLINSRPGNGAYDYVSLSDNEIPQKECDAHPSGRCITRDFGLSDRRICFGGGSYPCAERGIFQRSRAMRHPSRSGAQPRDDGTDGSLRAGNNPPDRGASRSASRVVSSGNCFCVQRPH